MISICYQNDFASLTILLPYDLWLLYHIESAAAKNPLDQIVRLKGGTQWTSCCYNLFHQAGQPTSTSLRQVGDLVCIYFQLVINAISLLSN